MKANRPLLSISLLLMAVLAAVEGALLFKLQGDNQGLREAADKAGRGGKGDLAEKLVKRDAELQVLRVQVQDLLRLRQELRLLRGGSNELTRLQQENRQLKEGSTNAPEPAPIIVNTDAEGAVVPRDNWTFAGYATPEATLQSWMWSLRDGDTDAFLESLSTDGRARFGAQMSQEGRTEDELIAQIRRQAEAYTAFQILDQTSVSDDTMVLLVQMSGNDVTRHRFVFTRTGNEWRMSDAGVEQ